MQIYRLHSHINNEMESIQLRQHVPHSHGGKNGSRWIRWRIKLIICQWLPRWIIRLAIDVRQLLVFLYSTSFSFIHVEHVPISSRNTSGLAFPAVLNGWHMVYIIIFPTAIERNVIGNTLIKRANQWCQPLWSFCCAQTIKEETINGLQSKKRNYTILTWV